jgi:hypothetical protein
MSAGKIAAAAALVAALLGIGGVALWLTRETPSEVAQAEEQAIEPTANPASTVSQDQVPPAGTTEPQPGEEEQEETPEPMATQPTKPVSAPVPRPSQQTAPPPLAPEPQEEPAAPVTSREPADEPAATYTPPVEEPAAADTGSMEEMRRLAGDLQTESAQLIDTYQAFLDAKDEAEQEITDNDELLQEQIEELSDTAERFHKQLEGGGLIGRLRKRSGDDVTRIQQRSRDLNQRGEQVDTLMGKVQPNPEVRQAWQSIRRKWKRAVQIAAGLR